ncbi:MAG: hypothetical protein J1E05_08245 [Eubacterium sp.]|nr:hypothetical protein [Eubacterium sp.]
MYEKIHSAGKLKRDWRLWLAITACALILVICILPIIFSANYQRQYHLFQESLADSTLYSRQNNSLTMERDGEIISLDTDGGYHKLLLNLVTAGAGRTGEPPEETAEIIFTFGNGASLELWGVELVGYVDTDAEYGLFLRYTYPDGKIYAYDTAEINMDKALTLLESD